MGHWAQDGKLSPQHFQSRVHNAIVYGGTPEELLRTVITLFSYEGQWVIDLLGTAGKVFKRQYLVKLRNVLTFKCFPAWPWKHKNVYMHA